MDNVRALVKKKDILLVANHICVNNGQLYTHRILQRLFHLNAYQIGIIMRHLKESGQVGCQNINHTIYYWSKMEGLK